MSNFTIKEVTTRRDLRKFIAFPDKLYKDCPQWVPALRGDQVKSLTSCASLKYCKHKLWLAYDASGKIVGRISGMINPRYNELYKCHRARFGWFDTINDHDVAALLLSTAEAWAKEEGMDEIHGPLYYNTLGKQGMLVEGFEHTPVFNVLYNFPYYQELVESLGYEKECDWIELKVPAYDGATDKLRRVSNALIQRYGLHEGNIEDLKKDPEKVKEFFRAYNESFLGSVHNFVPFTDEEIEEETASFLPYLKHKTCIVILDADENLAAFGISVPDLSEALKKAKGHLFPFGWWHILRAMKHYENVDMLLNGAVPKWQNSGISAILHTLLGDRYVANGTRWAFSNPQLETNGAALNVWSRYASELHMRRRCYLKKLQPCDSAAESR